MRYSSVTFTSADIQEWQKDLLISSLAHLGYDTFEDKENGFSAYIPSAQIDIQALESMLLSEVDGFNIQYDVEELEDENWNKLWESNFNPITVGDQCYVRATFHEDRPDMPYQIVIDPKMSFGTGHHQTTSLMLTYILEGDFKNKEVLDMGCGTGILAILSMKCGAKSAHAVDFDEICIASVEENKVLNKVEKITTAHGSKEQLIGLEFDVILANINRNILIDQLDQYALSSRPGALMYVSGFYESEDLPILRAKAEAVGFDFVDNKVLDSWCAAKFIKN